MRLKPARNLRIMYSPSLAMTNMMYALAWLVRDDPNREFIWHQPETLDMFRFS